MTIKYTVLTNITNGPSEQKPIKILEKRECGHIQGVTAQSFKVTPIISGTGKDTNFKFCTHFHAIDRNKSPLTISGKVVVGIAMDSRHFSGHPYGVSRGHLCDSTAVKMYIYLCNYICMF